METTYALHAVVLIGAMFQSVTGIGFAMIAGPVILMVVNSTAAIQINIILNLLIAVVFTPFVFRQTDRRLLSRITSGALVGIPVGVVLFQIADIGLLKLLSAVVIATMTFLLIFNAKLASLQVKGSLLLDVMTGAIGGILTAFLAMPGPAVAAYMGAAGTYDKQTTRATILIFFVLAYASAFSIHAMFVGIDLKAVRTSLELAPATLAGIGVGAVLASRVNEKMYRALIILVLAATSVSLFSGSIF